MLATEPTPITSCARLLDFMREADRPGLINLAAGVPGLDALPQPALAAATQRALERDGARLFAYHHPEGDLELRELVAERLQMRGVVAQGKGIVVVTGCTQALQLMLSITVQPGDVVACEAPAYYGLLELLSAARVRVLPLPVADVHGLDPDAIAPLLEQWRPKVVVVCSSLSNPSGATLPESRRERLVQLCGHLGIRLIDDDIYGELRDEGPLSPLRRWDPEGRIVSYVSSFSKSISPGVRVGVCQPAADLHEELANRKCQQDLHGSVVSEAILREFLFAGHFPPHLEWLRARNRQRRALASATVRESFPAGTELWEPAGGYMLWARLPHGVNMLEVRELALEQKIVFGNGAAFFTEPAERPCVRLNCAKASEADLEHGIRTLGRLLRESTLQ